MSGARADQTFGDRLRGYISAEIGEDYSFEWGLTGLNENDLFHLREALHRYFRHVAAESVGNANDIRFHVALIQRVGELVAAIEAVEKARGDATGNQTKWRQAKRDADYRREQAEMREKARLSVPRTSSYGDPS